MFALSDSTDELVEAAREQLAIDEVLATDESVRADWVVRKELGERRVAATAAVRWAFEAAYSDETAEYYWAQPGGGPADWLPSRPGRCPPWCPRSLMPTTTWLCRSVMS